MSAGSSEKVAGVEQAAEPCWYAETPDGHAWEYGDGSPHWGSETKAREQLVQMLQADRGQLADLTLRRESDGCWHLTCDGCGYRFDEDEWVSHFPGRPDALDVLDSYEWRVVDNRALCPECVDEAAVPEPADQQEPIACVADKGTCPCSLVTATGGTCGVFGPPPTFAEAFPYLSTRPETRGDAR